MGIQRYKVAAKASFCVLLVLLLVAAVSFIEKKEAQEGFVRELLDPASELLDDDTVRLASLVVWILLAFFLSFFLFFLMYVFRFWK